MCSVSPMMKSGAYVEGDPRASVVLSVVGSFTDTSWVSAPQRNRPGTGTAELTTVREQGTRLSWV